MTTGDIERLYFRSLDEALTDPEKQLLADGLRSYPGLATELERYVKIRGSVIRTSAATFGPYFAQKVIARLEHVSLGFDEFIAVFFRKYQLAAVGIFVALFTVNVIFSDQVSLPSILGVQDDSEVLAEEDIEAFDFSPMFNQ